MGRMLAGVSVALLGLVVAGCGNHSKTNDRSLYPQSAAAGVGSNQATGQTPGTSTPPASTPPAGAGTPIAMTTLYLERNNAAFIPFDAELELIDAVDYAAFFAGTPAGAPPATPAVDFAREVVVVVCREAPESNYELDIVKVERLPTEVLVTFTFDQTTAPANPTLEGHWHAVKVPATGLPVTFVQQ